MRQIAALFGTSKSPADRIIDDLGPKMSLRLAPEEYGRLLTAVRAGAGRKALAAEYGIGRSSVDRLAAS